jgi:sugar lactone lactonase YvrE
MVGCECLDGTCIGISVCLDGFCLPAAQPEVEGPVSAIAGLAIPLDGQIGNDDDDDDNGPAADEIEWSHVEGPNAQIDFPDRDDARAYLAADAADLAKAVFRLTARLGEVVATADLEVNIKETTIDAPLDEVPDALALLATHVVASDGAYWLGTPEGTLARVNDGEVADVFDLGTPIGAMRRYQDGRLLVAEPDAQAVVQFDMNLGEANVFIASLSGGAPLGSVTALAVDGDGNVYMTTATGDLVLYDNPDDGEPATTVVLAALPGTSTALALGQVPVPPDDDEGDEGVVLYVGTSGGTVLEYGLTQAEGGVEGPPLGEARSYVSVGGSITGLAIDGLGNMWVGTPDRLLLVRRPFGESPSVVRELPLGEGPAGFAALSTADEVLTWVDPASGRVGRLDFFDG